MVTPAKIVGKGSSNNTYKVQVIAYYNYLMEGGDENIDHTIDARVSISPGVVPAYKIGDMVYVCIEDNKLDVPVIMGALKCDALKSACDASFNSLKVTGTTKLSKDTSIGDITSENLECLSNLKGNIQSQIDTSMQKQITLLEKMAQVLNQQFV